MNVLRSLARDLWNVLDVSKTGVQSPDVGATTLNAARQKAVPAVLGLSRFRDGFEQFPQGAVGTLRTLQAERAFRPQVTAQALQRDGFDGARRLPVDLSGGFKPSVHVTNAVPTAPVQAAPAFSASLQDLSALF
jgi:hypothetical protein